MGVGKVKNIKDAKKGRKGVSKDCKRPFFFTEEHCQKQEPTDRSAIEGIYEEREEKWNVALGLGVRKKNEEGYPDYGAAMRDFASRDGIGSRQLGIFDFWDGMILPVLKNFGSGKAGV